MPITEDPDDRVGTVTSNVPIKSYLLEANTSGDDLLYFLQEDYVVTINGDAVTLMFEDTLGTPGFDWLSADAEGITVNGRQGDDVLHSTSANVVLNAEEGDDILDLQSP